MEGIFVKQIKDSDPVLVDTLCRLEVENLGQEVALNQWILPVIIRYGRVFIAGNNKDGRIIGACEVIRSYQVPSTAFIHSLYISREFRNAGVGKQLLGKVLDGLRSGPFKEVQLTVDPDNIPAACLYRSFGFKKAHTRKNEYGRGIHRDLLFLRL